MTTKADKILIIFLVFIAISFYIGLNQLEKPLGSYVIISVEGKEFKTLPLDKDTTYTIENGKYFNKIEIKNNSVKMIDANCIDKYCIKHSKLNSVRGAIVCLPNKVMVEIIGDSENQFEIDAFST